MAHFREHWQCHEVESNHRHEVLVQVLSHCLRVEVEGARLGEVGKHAFQRPVQQPFLGDFTPQKRNLLTIGDERVVRGPEATLQTLLL
jgi:hypothetical protein